MDDASKSAPLLTRQQIEGGEGEALEIVPNSNLFTNMDRRLLTRAEIEGGAMEIVEQSRAGAGLRAIKELLDDIQDIVEDGIEREK